jgi:hypothetical protein
MWSRLAPALAAVTVVAVAGSATAADYRWFTYDADSDAARHRSADITLQVQRGLMSSRVVKLFRKRGKDLELDRPDGAIGWRQLEALFGRDVAEGLRLYAVDTKDGEGFAQGACKGADRAWLALKAVKPYEPLQIFVLRYDATTKTAELCETLDYRWRGEWRLPPRKNASAIGDFGAPPPR